MKNSLLRIKWCWRLQNLSEKADIKEFALQASITLIENRKNYQEKEVSK